jgi:hypothetical protein
MANVAPVPEISARQPNAIVPSPESRVMPLTSTKVKPLEFGLAGEAAAGRPGAIAATIIATKGKDLEILFFSVILLALHGPKA